MSDQPALELPAMPFCLGAMAEPSNPGGLPNTYPFRLGVNRKLVRLEQIDDAALRAILARAYAIGAEMGTPSDATDLGQPYVDDFVRFIGKFSRPPGRLLEIGAGTGYLSKVLKDAGWQVTSVEPGRGYERHWRRHNVSVVNDFFPSSQVVGKFDAIVFYTVIEHLPDTRAFLDSVRAQLEPAGRIFLGVPDCTAELLAADPSMLLHEHYQYFSGPSLANTLLDGGFVPTIERSAYGRSLLATGCPSQAAAGSPADDSELPAVLAYGRRVQAAIETVGAKLRAWSAAGPVGVYCPSRALPYLPPDLPLRLYDDAASIQGKYYPPFASRVQGRPDLLQNPPDTLLIASRTFGAKLRHELLALGLPSTIILLSEVLP